MVPASSLFSSRFLSLSFLSYYYTPRCSVLNHQDYPYITTMSSTMDNIRAKIKRRFSHKDPERK